MKRSVEMRQARAKLVHQAETLTPATGTAWTSEIRSQFDKIMLDVDLMKADIDKLERLEAIGEELDAPLGGSAAGGALRSSGGAISEPGEVDPRILEQQQRAYRRAFGTYLRRGASALTSDELGVLRTQGRSTEYRADSGQDNTTGPGGGFLIPSGFQAELEIALKQFGGMRTAARTITTTTGAVLPWPTTNDTNVMGRRLGANAIVNQAQTSSQSFGQVQFNAWTYTSDVIRIPNELLNDSAFDLESEATARFGERIGRIQNYEFTNLVGSGGPGGFVPLARVGKTGAAGETTSMTYDDVIDMEHSIDPAYRNGGSYMCHDMVLATLRKIKDQYGRPLFGVGLEEGAPDTLNGRPIINNQDMAIPAAGAKTLAFGNFSKYIIRDVAASAVVVRLTELYALANETAFVAFLRSDGNLIDAGTHPIAVFQQAAA